MNLSLICFLIPTPSQLPPLIIMNLAIQTAYMFYPPIKKAGLSCLHGNPAVCVRSVAFRHHLAMVLAFSFCHIELQTQCQNENFFMYINEFRIKEAQFMMKDEKFKDYNLIIFWN